MTGKQNTIPCPINQQTGDGVPCGRCYHRLCGDVCPIHGDVSIEVDRFLLDREMTLENVMRKRKGLTLLGDT